MACLLSAAPLPVDAASRACPKGSFLSVMMPDQAKEEHGTSNTPVGSVEHYTVRGSEGDTEVSITASVLAPAMLNLTSSDMLYRKARNRLVGEYDGEVQGWSECEHAGFDCRKLRYTASGGRHGIARLYLDDDTIVIVNAVYLDDPADSRKFLASARRSD